MVMQNSTKMGNLELLYCHFLICLTLLRKENAAYVQKQGLFWKSWLIIECKSDIPLMETINCQNKLAFDPQLKLWNLAVAGVLRNYFNNSFDG